jgi:hypothetical protein
MDGNVQGKHLPPTIADEMDALDRWLYLPIRTYVDARMSLVNEPFAQEQLKMAQILQREDNEHH